MSGTVQDDAELLRRIGRGEEAAFATLLDRHGSYLHGVARALVSNSADADDLVQETFVGVLRSKFRGESSVRTWLVRILINRVKMLRRTRARHGGDTKEILATDAEIESKASPVGAPIDAKLDLAQMLEALSPEHRSMIVLRELEQMSYEQIAAALDVPRGTVESRLHRAREELRKRFKGYGS